MTKHKIIIGVLALTMLSCSSRKVNKSVIETKESSQTQTAKIDTSKTVTKSDTNTKLVDTSVIDEMEIVPIDSSKEIEVNGVKYKGVILRHKKTKVNKVLDKTENVVKIEQKAVSEQSKASNSRNAVIKQKEIVKKQPYKWLWWLLLLIPLYIIQKKYNVAGKVWKIFTTFV